MTDIDRSRQFNEADHPRGKGAQGGEFVKKDSGQQPSTAQDFSRQRNAERQAAEAAARKQKQKPKQQQKQQPRNTNRHGSKPPAKLASKPGDDSQYIRQPGTGEHNGPLKRGGKNDPAQVKELQALLHSLGMSNRGATGEFDQDTEDAVKEAQRRLGLHPNGHASTALVNKLLAAHALSPCVKRSGDLFDCADIARAEFPNLSYALESGHLEENIMRTDLAPEWSGTYDLLDLEIQRSGDGRTVVGLAAVWDTPTKVRDQHGYYIESISRGAFDKTIRERGDRPFPVLYNHGFTAAGTPSDAYSVPIGRSVEVRADAKGLYTVSRYNDGPDSDRVLEAIRNGAITSQSFRGPVYKSQGTPSKHPTDKLPTVTRTELGLTEYGPTPSAVYRDAAILAVRSAPAALATLLASRFDLDRLLELARTSTTPEEEPETLATPTPGAGADEPDEYDVHSSRLAIRRARARAELILIGAHGGT